VFIEGQTSSELPTDIWNHSANVSLINFFIVVPTDVFVGPEVANVTWNYMIVQIKVK
jgi:hypothetical protein